MFDKDTLQLIISQAIAANAIADTHTPVAVLPEGVNVLSLEKFQATRSRFRGALNTHSLLDFADYTLARHGEAKGFVNQDEMSCKVFFNLGDEDTPGHADDIAVLKLKPTAAYTALQHIAGQKLTQREAAEWMEDWSSNLKATKEGGADMPILLAIASVRDITIKSAASANHSEHNFGAARSAMDSIEAANAESRVEALYFTCTPYEGLGVRTFTLKFSILTGAEKPVLKLRWVGEELQREEIAKEFKTVLGHQIGGAATLTLGTFAA